MLATDEAHELESPARSRLSRALRWLWKAPLLAVGGIAALACGAVVLLLVIGLLELARRALADLPIVYLLAAFGAMAVGLTIGQGVKCAWTPSDQPIRTLGWLRWLALAVLACVIAAVGIMLVGFFRPPAANHPAGTFVALGLATLPGLGVWAWKTRGELDTVTLSVTLGPAAILLCAAAFGGFTGYNDRTQGELHDYCSYGAVSSAQLRGCLDHVTVAQIDRLNTDAARFAAGPLDSCLGDAGPYCASALANRQYQPGQ